MEGRRIKRLFFFAQKGTAWMCGPRKASITQ